MKKGIRPRKTDPTIAITNSKPLIVLFKKLFKANYRLRVFIYSDLVPTLFSYHFAPVEPFLNPLPTPLRD